jgi:hypothetical protein
MINIDTVEVTGSIPISPTSTHGPTGQHHRTESQRLDIGALIGPIVVITVVLLPWLVGQRIEDAALVVGTRSPEVIDRASSRRIPTCALYSMSWVTRRRDRRRR